MSVFATVQLCHYVYAVKQLKVYSDYSRRWYFVAQYHAL